MLTAQSTPNNFQPMDFNFQNNFFLQSNDLITEISTSNIETLLSDVHTKEEWFDVLFYSATFDCDFKFEIIDIIPDRSANQIEFVLGIEDVIVIRLIVLGSWHTDDKIGFLTEQINLKLEHKFETPLSVFVVSNLWAVIALSSKFTIKIPEIGFDVSAGFTLSLKEIQTLLQERQIAQRLMVIESTSKTQLPFPNGYISGNDIENIAFSYHAFTSKRFKWFSPPTVIPWKANQESLSWLPENKDPKDMTFYPEPLSKKIFGQEVYIGVMTARVKDSVIDNYDDAKEKLSRLNNEIVEVKFRAVSGSSEMICVKVPRFNLDSWGEELKKLYKLEDKLDQEFANKYFKLASSTLEYLTTEQKELILERPKIYPESHLSE